MAEGDTWVNALIGAIATTILGPVIPFAPVVGGAVAGYLEGGDSGDGFRVGAYSGLIALIPTVIFAFLVTSLIGGLLVGFGGLDGALVGGLGGLLLVIVLFFLLVYVVGLSLLGGWIGNYLQRETDL